MEISITSLEKMPENKTLWRFLDALDDFQLKYYALDWMKSIGYDNVRELNRAISPLIDALKSAELSTSENIKPVYRCSRGYVFKDWKLSRLGLIYLAFNSPHKSPELSRLQLKMLSTYFSNR